VVYNLKYFFFAFISGNHWLLRNFQRWWVLWPFFRSTLQQIVGRPWLLQWKWTRIFWS
jgi:hypothetical protein